MTKAKTTLISLLVIGLILNLTFQNCAKNPNLTAQSRLSESTPPSPKVEDSKETEVSGDFKADMIEFSVSNLEVGQLSLDSGVLKIKDSSDKTRDCHIANSLNLRIKAKLEQHQVCEVHHAELPADTVVCMALEIPFVRLIQNIDQKEFELLSDNPICRTQGVHLCANEMDQTPNQNLSNLLNEVKNFAATHCPAN